MKKQKLLNNLKHRLSLLLCLMAFLTVGQSAWATLYVYGSENVDNVNEYTYLGSTDDLSFTWNRTFSTGKWYRVIFEKSKGGTQAMFQSDGIYCKNVSRDETKFSAASSQEWGAVYSMQFSVSSNLTSVTITISTNPSSKSCNFEKKSGVYCADYSVAGGAPTPSTDTWEIRGFGDWTSGKHMLSEIDGELSCTINLSKEGTYTAGTTNGFKVVKNDGSDHFYGAQNTTITRSNSSAACSASGETSWNFGLSADITGNYKFTLTNVSGNTPELTVTFPASTYAIARWGDAPTIDGDKDITASAYVATHGCNGSTDYTVTQLKVRYWKEGDEANSEVKETATGIYVPGTACGIEILSNESNVLMNCTTESKIIMEVACKNGLGWSAYSDRMAVMYTANKEFVTIPLEEDFTACEGSHQFTLSEMVKPVPDSWTVTSGGTDSDFTLADGEMIWNPGDKTSETYNYTFKFTKAGYPNGTATLKITYTKTAPEGGVSITTPSASSVNATKFEEVSLVATKGTGVEKIKWLVTPDTYITTTNSDGTNAKFQGKAVTKYTVTAVGLSESCGETASNTKQITVTKDTEECNE